MNADEVKVKWLNIQKRSYTNWINEVLRPTGVVVNDIVDDIGSGVLLCKLAMLLTMKKIRYQKNPKLVFQRQENIQKALNLIEQSGCKLINIGASDILTKNEKLILGLMWQLVQHFHVFQSIKNVKSLNQSMKDENLMGNAGDVSDEIYDELSPAEKKKKSSEIKKHIIEDMNRRMAPRGVEVRNFKADWKDGEALCALVDYNVKGIYDLYTDSDPVQKVAQSMIAAYKFLGIPQLIEPEDFISNLIDEQTMSMYLSCFVHEGIEQISVDLFEGMEKVEKNDELVEKVAKAKPTLVKTKSMIQIDNGSEKAADVLGYIQVLQEEEEKGKVSALSATKSHVQKILHHLPPKPEQHSLSEILSPQTRSNSDSSIDEGIGAELTDVSLQSTPSKLSPEPDSVELSEDVIGKVSLEASLPSPDLDDTIEAPEPDSPTANVADIIEDEIQLEIEAEIQATTQSSPPTLPEPECPSPGEIEGEVGIELLSPDNQEELRQKLGASLNATISDEITSILGDNDQEDVSALEATLGNDVDITAGHEWEADDPIRSTSLEATIPDIELPAVEVEVEAPVVEVEVEAPVVEIETPVEIKTPVVEVEVEAPAVEIEAPAVEIETPVVEVEVEAPVVEIETPAVEIETPAVELEVETPAVEIEAPAVEVEVETPAIKLEVETPDVEIETPAVEVEVKTPSVEVEVPTAEVEVETPRVDLDETSAELAAGAIGIAASGAIVAAALEAASTSDIEVEVETPAVQIEAPAVELEAPSVEIETPDVEVETPSLELEAPSVEIETPDVEVETPSLELEAPSVEIETPDVEVETPSLELELPSVEIETPDVEVETPSLELEAPSVEIETPDVEVKAPAVELEAPSVEIETPDVELETTVDIEIPSKEVAIGLAATGVVGAALDNVLSESMEADIAIQAVQVETSAPEIETPSVEVGVETPSVEVEVETPSVEVEVPTAEVEVEAPKVDLDETSAELAAGAIGIAASGAIVAAALGAASTSDIEVEVETAAVEIETPAVEIETPAVEIEAPAVEVEIKTPAVEIEAPAVGIETPVIEIETPAVEVEAPAFAIETPAVEVEAPAVEIEIETPAVEIETPAFAIETPAVEVETPAVEIEIETPAVEIETPAVEVEAPAVEVEIETPVVEIETPAVEIETPALEIETPAFEIDTPSVEIEAPAVEIETPAVEIETPAFEIETPAVDIETPAVEIKTPAVEVEAPAVEVEIETPAVEIEAPAVEIEAPTVEIEAPAVEIETPAVEIEAPAVEIETPAVEVEAPAFAIETPAVEMKKPAVEIEAPAVEIEAPAVEIETPELMSYPAAVTDIAVDTPKAVIELPEIEPEIELEVPEVEVKVAAEVDVPEVEIPVAAAVNVATEVEVPSASDMSMSGGEADVESLPSIDVSFALEGEYKSDGEMVIPAINNDPIYSVSTKQRKLSKSSSGGSSSKKRVSVAASSNTGTGKSMKSIGSSFISGGDEISLADVRISHYFPSIDSRLVLLLANMDSTNQDFETSKEQFRKFIAKSDIDYRSVSFLKCCQLMRISLTAANFKIIGAGEHVMFDDLPYKLKRGISKLTLKKKKSSKKIEHIDPLLAQLSAKSASLKKGNTADQPLSKKQMQRQKELGNAAINLYTEVIQCYQNYKTMMQTAQSWEGAKLEPRYGDSMDTMQEEIMMATMILTGQCSPD